MKLGILILREGGKVLHSHDEEATVSLSVGSHLKHFKLGFLSLDESLSGLN